MAQLTVYLDAEAERVLRDQAAASGLSHSKWLSNLIRQSKAQNWPNELMALAGAWSDDASIAVTKKRVRAAAKDTRREAW
jgi:hypothetical protein